LEEGDKEITVGNRYSLMQKCVREFLIGILCSKIGIGTISKNTYKYTL